MSSKKINEDDEPKSITRSMNVTPQHYADLKALEQNGKYITHEHPSILKHYFKGINLKFNLFDSEFKRDVDKINKITFSDLRKGYKKTIMLWQVKLVDGAKIFVTKKRQTSGNKIFVTVEQDVDMLPSNTEKKDNVNSFRFENQICPFCEKSVTNLDIHILDYCKKKV